MAKPGPRSKLTREIEAEFCRLVAKGQFRSTAADQLGIGERTIKTWMRRGRDDLESEDDGDAAPETRYARFRLAVLRAEAEAEAMHVDGIIQAGKKDWRAMAWYLERKNHRRYGNNPNARAFDDEETDDAPAEALAEILLRIRKIEISEAGKGGSEA